MLPWMPLWDPRKAKILCFPLPSRIESRKSADRKKNIVEGVCFLNPGFQSSFSTAFISVPLRRCLLWRWRNLPCFDTPLHSPWSVPILSTALMKCAQKRWISWLSSSRASSLFIKAQFQGLILILGMSVWMSPQISRFDREVTFLSGLCFFFLRRGWLRQGVKGSVGKGKWPSCDSVLSWSSPTVHSPEEPQSSSLQCLPGRAGQADQQLCAGDLCWATEAERAGSPHPGPVSFLLLRAFSSATLVSLSQDKFFFFFFSFQDSVFIL